MVERRVSEAADAMGGEVIAGDPAARWRGASIDSRRIRHRELFFALPGERVDGHDFLPQAIRSGAAAVVVHREIAPAERDRRAAWIRVKDTYPALHALTRAIRAEVPERLVGITGSTGKTTTKELLAAMLNRRFHTERSPGNLNNLYGFPLSLLNIADDCEWMVAEMGMSTPGELRLVSLLGKPDAAVFTNVRPAHLENFRNLRDIADAKAELLAGLAAGGLVVANADDPEVLHIVARHRAEQADSLTRYVLYGLSGALAQGAASTVTASPPRPRAQGQTGSRFVLTAQGESVDIELPLHGLYNVENCLAAAACAHALGVELDEIATAVAVVSPGKMRGEVHRRGDFTVIDDSYNSNPDAACRALSSARMLPADRHVAILGDMLELGADGPAFHRDVGEQAARLGFCLVVGVGEQAREIVAAAGRGGAETLWLADARTAVRWIASERSAASSALTPEDLILVKGSRGVGLEIVVEALLDLGGEAG